MRKLHVANCGLPFQTLIFALASITPSGFYFGSAQEALDSPRFALQAVGERDLPESLLLAIFDQSRNLESDV